MTAQRESEADPTRAAGWLAAVRAQQKAHGVDAPETTDDSRPPPAPHWTTVWIMRGVACGPPNNTCHVAHILGIYASKAECEAEIPAMPKRRFDDYHVPKVDGCEAEAWIDQGLAESAIRGTKEGNLKADLSNEVRGPAGIVYMWRMDATWCGPYPVDPTQTVCKEQSLGSYGSEALCTADISEMQKEGYADLSCERIAIQEPCSDVVCGP